MCDKSEKRTPGLIEGDLISILSRSLLYTRQHLLDKYFEKTILFLL